MIYGGFAFSLVGLVLVEQLYRNMRNEMRWSVKFLCLGVGVMFAFDLYLYSTGLLFRIVEPAVWVARGAVNILVVPLIAVTAARKPKWSKSFNISRNMVFYTASVFTVGVYLFAMAVGGYYVRIFGGSWGAVAQLVFLSGALITLLVALFSGQVRARFRVFLSKHFMSYRYDYREEWLRLIDTLSDPQSDAPLSRRAILAVGKIVESPGGKLWLCHDSGDFTPVAAHPGSVPDRSLRTDSPLSDFLIEREWIVDVGECESDPELYAGLDLPDWLKADGDAWLVVPLLLPTQLLGFIVLDKPHAAHRLSWEEIDILRTVGKQVAGYLAQDMAAKSLTEARQFEAYNRLTTFIMHDLKNLIAQQSLVVENAARHKHDPEFVEDAIATIDNSVQRMNRLLAQLKQGDTGGTSRRVDLEKLLERVVSGEQHRLPPPTLAVEADGLLVFAPEQRLAMVLRHLIRNAQEATADDGRVTVGLREENATAIIDIEDNGTGMDAAFIRDRLFTPFDTTKGSQGMGIGVYQAREVVRMNNGDLIVRSTPGEGTCVKILLPVLSTDEMRGEQ